MGVKIPIDGAARHKVNMESRVNERMRSDASLSRKAMDRLQEIWKQNHTYEKMDQPVTIVEREKLASPVQIPESTRIWIKDVKETIKASQTVHPVSIDEREIERSRKIMTEDFQRQILSQ